MYHENPLSDLLDVYHCGKFVLQNVSLHTSGLSLKLEWYEGLTGGITITSHRMGLFHLRDVHLGLGLIWIYSGKRLKEIVGMF